MDSSVSAKKKTLQFVLLVSFKDRTTLTFLQLPFISFIVKVKLLAII